jgi:hypothetical protein
MSDQVSQNEAPTAIAVTAPGSDPLTYSRMLRQIDETVKALNAHPGFPLPRI